MFLFFLALLQLKHIKPQLFESDSPSPTSIPFPSPTPTTPRKKGLSTTAIIALICGVTVGGSAIIIFLIFWIINKAKSNGHNLEENLMESSSLPGFHDRS